MNCKRGSVREWIRRLVEQKYIRIERDRRGIRVFILNPKKFRVSNPRHSERGYAPRNKDTYAALLRNNLTKQLNNNKDALAPFFSTEEKRRELQEQTERQTLLARQKQEILAKYQPKEQPGQVIAIRKEATA